VNCSSFKEENIEKDFYSFLKNNFTEVDKIEIGKFRIINKATLYFEEVNLLPIEFQSKLVNSLKNGRFEFNGNPGVIYLDVRVIATTSQNLEKLVKKNLLSKDLYFYLNTFPVTIPPLRERKSDIPILVENFIKQFNQKYGKQISKVPKKNIDLLQDYSWPGNVKELENVIESAVILSNTSLLKIEGFLKKDQSQSKKILTLADFEREYIIKILNMTYWRVAGKEGAAKILGLHPETLRSKMRKLQISKQDNTIYNEYR
jgi:DNA-binding NtrC family response regulator